MPDGLLTEAEFEKVLVEKYSLTKSSEGTQHQSFWKTKAGQHLALPKAKPGERYNDYLFGVVEFFLNRVNQNPLYPGGRDAKSFAHPRRKPKHRKKK